jgi:hypothetical protein
MLVFFPLFPFHSFPFANPFSLQHSTMQGRPHRHSYVFDMLYSPAALLSFAHALMRCSSACSAAQLEALHNLIAFAFLSSPRSRVTLSKQSSSAFVLFECDPFTQQFLVSRRCHHRRYLLAASSAAVASQADCFAASPACVFLSLSFSPLPVRLRCHSSSARLDLRTARPSSAVASGARARSAVSS